jgi:hypothetical protein
MGKFAGLVMILAGVGTAAYVYPAMTTATDRGERQAADAAAIATAGSVAKVEPPAIRLQPTTTTSGPAKVSPRVISAEPQPGKPGLFGSTSASTSDTTTGATPTPSGQTLPSSLTPLAPAQVAQATKPIEAPVPVAAKKPKADDEARTTLTREIQRELKRVGCFGGDVDGVWSSGTRQAMKSFNDRVNATLPIDDPDHILKTLVQGHPGGACGKSCPSGQSAASDGRCLPTAIIAQQPAGKKPADRVALAPSPAVSPSTSTAPSSVATPAAPTTTATPAAPSTWETRVTSAPAAPLPAPQTTQPMGAIAAAVQPSVPASRIDALPGRMAMGAPEVPAPVPAINVGPAPTEPVLRQTQSAADAAGEPKLKRAAPKIVVKPKARPEASDASNPDVAAKPQIEPETKSRPKLGAVAAVERDDALAPAKPQRVERPDPPRAVVERRPPPQRVVAYVPPPPPRYVGAYNPPPVYRERQRFGPQIFRQLDAMSGR